MYKRLYSVVISSMVMASISKFGIQVWIPVLYQNSNTYILVESSHVCIHSLWNLLLRDEWVVWSRQVGQGVETREDVQTKIDMNQSTLIVNIEKISKNVFIE
jgi:hypothetical protein